MSEGSLEDFGRIILSKEDIALIGKQNTAFLGATLYVANEILVLQKLLASHFNRPTVEDSDLSLLSFINRFVIVRTLSARTFELMKMFEDQRKIWNRASMTEELELTKHLADRLSELKGDDYYRFSSALRNKITNHYVVSDVSSYMEAVEDGADLSIYLHEEQGNSFFPLGEEVVFMGFTNQFLTDMGYPEENRQHFIRDWTGWLLNSVRWSNDLVSTFSVFIYITKLKHESVEIRKYLLPDGYVADIREFASPLILRDWKKRDT